MDISDLVNQEKGVPIEFGAMKFKVWYRVSQATRSNLLGWSEKVQAAQSDPDKNVDDVLKIVDEQLVELLTRWDLTDKGAPYPCTAETLAGMPEPIKNTIRMAIYQDNGTDAKKEQRKSSMTG